MSFAPINFEVPTIAVAKSRAKRGAYGQAYIPMKTQNFEAELRWQWRKYGFEMLPCVPTRLIVACYLPKPLKPKFQLPAVRPDVDNYLKAILDGLSGFAWKDDGQVTRAEIAKRYADAGNPRVVIQIYPDSGV